MFLDLAWGGLQGKVIYPPFVNGNVVRTVRDPDGQPITRAHDNEQLKETLRRCRPQYRQPNTALHHACCASKCQVRCRVPPMARLFGSQSRMTRLPPWK